MTRAAPFWNFIANRYALSKIADVESYSRKLEMTQAVMAPDMRVLEFGCGTGSTAVTHAPYVAKFTGIDYAQNMINIARGKAEGTSNLAFEVATLENWDAPDASYDMILGLNIMHLLPDHLTALSKVRKLLRPGGYFVHSTACLGDMGGVLPYILPMISATRLIPPVLQLSAAQLEQDIVNAGFELREDWRPGKGRAVFMIAQAV